ncbi:hypothetical protein [Williamsia sterculiae]|uniref:Uncharacterized protein n=1 Tax=Williamsia sterculiae TaxID=1344003 RepID=A0A1N7DHP8_9NOCA|nr:hypothetical protein [Williamsia sterculiae]SIR75383.1 hypothetical protein SAMN05445060_0645 [Williamsia sterculiae]
MSSLRAPASVHGRVLRLGVVGAIASLAVAGCAGTTNSPAPSSSLRTVPVPVSADVTVPTGAPDRTPPGTTLTWGQSAYLPADAFRATGQLAMFTVTGVEPGSRSELPSSLTKGGDPFYVHLTISQLADKAVPAPSTEGFSASSDGRTPTRTVAPPDNFSRCVANPTPKTAKRGDSIATCVVAVVDPGTVPDKVIYWADTTGDSSLNYKASPVVWSSPAPAPASSPVATPTG